MQPGFGNFLLAITASSKSLHGQAQISNTEIPTLTRRRIKNSSQYFCDPNFTTDKDLKLSSVNQIQMQLFSKRVFFQRQHISEKCFSKNAY